MITARRLSLTGPTRLTEAEAAELVPVLAALGPRAEFTTGAAPGFDTFAADTLRNLYPKAIHRVVVPAAPYDEDGVLRAAREGALTVWLPKREPGHHAEAYRHRNVVLVSHGDALLAVVRRPTFYRSGEWMTVNIARRAGLPVSLVLIPAAVPA
jgi:hypothetical protein